MAKRKAAVNDIIYELDNDDVVISSDEEVRVPKINRLEVNTSSNSPSNDKNTLENCTGIINVDSSFELDDDIALPLNIDIGGKIDSDLVIVEGSLKQSEGTIDNSKKLSPEIYNEDIVIDSPASNIDLGVVGCENRTPLVTMRFRDKKLAMNYKEKIKAFMINLIRLHNTDSLESDHETDLELDIWPEDLNDEVLPEETEKVEDNLFFVDTDPCTDSQEDVPRYSQNSSLLSDIPVEEPAPPVSTRRGPTCFNCDGNHQLRDCQLPRNNFKIAEKRKSIVRMGRYHVEDEQKYGHLVPGRISGHLRHALGLKRHELPLHIYRMRLLGYPPGWLEEARISHSGITMFDSTGKAILDPEEEEGEVCEPGSKDKFDIKKILDFPGFNVPTSARYKEEAHLFGLPPMSEEDSKMVMLQMLAPNAMKAYKRKKLTFFPSAAAATAQEGQAEMELDSGDEVVEFPSIPPLPDDAPPPPLPPPPPPPSSPPPPPPSSPPPPPPSSPPPVEINEEQKSLNKIKHNEKTLSVEDDDVEIIEMMKVGDIPVPMADFITIDEDYETSQPSSCRESPSLDDLEEKKRLLLNALEGDTIPIDICVDGDKDNIEVAKVDSKTDTDEKIEADPDTKEDENSDKLNNIDETVDDLQKETAESQDVMECDSIKEEPTFPENNLEDTQRSTAISDSDIKTPDSKAGRVKTTLYGTPVMNIASSYVNLPSGEKFAKDICDVINFENLPNSTGKYKKISTLLKKVKSEVDRIQDS